MTSGVRAERLLALDAEYAEILALLDRGSATRRMVANVPELAGVQVAWIGEPVTESEIVLQHGVNTATNLVEGLVVPAGVGLGGQVLATRRPFWVSDYCTAQEITDHFKAEAAVEGLKAMIAVPILDRGRLLGVLYGANRAQTEFGDHTADALVGIAARIAAAQVVAERARHAAEIAVYEERRRVALELHDTVGAMLFTLGAGVRRLIVEPGLDPEVQARLSAIEQQTAEAAAALRGSLRVLSAPPQEVALGVAVREHCRAFEDRTAVSVRMIILTELPAMPGPRVRALADATREALYNVEKHAQARSVVVSLFALRDGVAVTVSDDGVGLDNGFASNAGLGHASNAGLGHANNAGLGLASISERLARVGGSLTIARNDDDGATLQAWVPA